MSYLPRKSLLRVSRASPCCARMVSSHVDRRVTYHLSSCAPYKLKMVLLDPPTMDGCETLALTRSAGTVTHESSSLAAHPASQLLARKGYTRLKVSRDQRFTTSALRSYGLNAPFQKPPRDQYSKIIQLDTLDFLYQLCFEIHQCRSDSFVSVGNLCGPRMKMIRLWSDWFTSNKQQHSDGCSKPSVTLFTKLIWTDSTFDVGFILSAREPASPGVESASPSSGLTQGLYSDSKCYQIDIDEMVIRNHHLLGLFEGPRT